MSAVATKPTPQGEKNQAQQTPTLAGRLNRLRLELRAVDQMIEDAYDAAERGESIDPLLDLINHNLLPDAVHPLLDDRVPSQAEVERVYDALFHPLAALDGAISLARGSILEHTLREAYRLLDAVQTDLDSAGELVKLLPAATPEQPRKADIDIDDTPEARRDLACEANFEISKLAEAVKRLMEGEEDQPIFNGIMGRIELLSDLLHHVMRLHGSTDEKFDSPPLHTLRAWYEGRPS